MSDVVIGSLRLRGPLAGRLARVAATTLPGALDAALAGYPDGRVDAVSVPFTVDAGLDDGSIAVLWAEAIRAAVHEALGPAVADAPAGAPGPPGTPLGLPTATDAVRASLEWLAEGARPDAVPRDAWLVGHPRLVEACRGLLARRWPDVVTALAGTVRGVPGMDPGGAPRPAPGVPGRVPGATEDGRAGGDPEPDPPEGDRAAGRPASGSATAVGRADPVPPRERLTADLAMVSTMADLLEGTSPSTVDTSLVTTAAGLALLHPWLADHCRAAEALHPGLDPGEVRAHALAALVDPGRPDPADPLVVRLAGLGHAVDHPAVLAHHERVVESADAVLRSFAGLLPGFARSSPEFVRREWVRRTGLLEEDRDPVRLTASVRPLDLVLDHLPYPLGLFVLPWCPPMSLRFRP